MMPYEGFEGLRFQHSKNHDAGNLPVDRDLS